MTTDTLVLLLGIFSSLTLIISALSVRRKRLLLFGIATNVILAAQYELVGSRVGFAICIVGLVRMVMVLISLRFPHFNHWGFVPVFLALHLTAFVTFNSWSDTTWVDFIPLVGGWAGVVAFYFSKVIYTKAILTVVGGLWLIYEFNMAMYGQLVGESLTMVANAIAFFTLLSAVRRGIPEEQIEDIDTQIIETITSSIPIIRESVETTITNSIKVIRMDTTDSSKH